MTRDEKNGHKMSYLQPADLGSVWFGFFNEIRCTAAEI
jgi:hypothetical protein